jgi:murein DD-endopeptidase MepM/ murein hydrolase activator NlpD
VVQIGVAVLIAVSLIAVARPTAADQYTDQIAADQAKQAKINAQIASLTAQIAAAQDQEVKLTAIISTLDGQIADTKGQVSAANAQLTQISSDLAASQASLVIAKQQLEHEKVQLERQVVIVYEVENQSTALANLLSDGNFNDFWTSVINNRRLSDAVKSQVDLMNEKQNEVQADVSRIADQQAQQRVVVAQLNGTLATLDGQRNARQSAVYYLQRLQAQDQTRMQQMQAANAALNNEIAQLQAQEAAAQAAGGGSGRFVWPDSGPISQGFGCTPYWFEPWDANCPNHHFHNGLDIAGACYNHIWAADSGIANIPPYMSYGYGNYIIIVHGNGWQTLYGHLAGFAIHNGQVVSRGQLIGYEGTTGNSTGCHLHFSVNHNGRWVNPLDYLP